MRGIGRFRNAIAGMEGLFASLGLANVALGTSSILIPLTIVHGLGGSVAQVGLQSSAASLMGVLGSVVWGRLADTVSRRKALLVLSVVVLGLAFVGMAFARSFPVLLASATVQSFFWAATGSVSILLLLHRGEKHAWEQKIGRLNQVTALGWLCGLVLGSAALSAAARFTTEAAATRGLFFLLAGIGAGATLLAIRLVPRQAASPERIPLQNTPLAGSDGAPPRSTPQVARRVVERLPVFLSAKDTRDRALRLLLAQTFLAWMGVGFFAVPLPILLAERFAIPSPQVFLYYVLLDVGVIAAYPFASRWSAKAGNRTVQTVGLLSRLALCLAGAAFLLLSASAPPWIALSLYFLVIGISYSFLQLSGVSLASRLAPEESRGRILGLFNAVIGAGMIVAGVGSGYLAQGFGYAAPFAAAAFLLLLALFALRTMRDPARCAGEPVGPPAREAAE